MLSPWIRLWDSDFSTQNSRPSTCNQVVWEKTKARSRFLVPVLSHVHSVAEEQASSLPRPQLAWSWHWTWDSPHCALLGCYPTQPTVDSVGRGGGCPTTAGGLSRQGSVNPREGKFHLRSGFLQTRCGALGIEAMFLSNAGKWSWGWRGGAEQAPRSNLGKEKKESEANRNRTVPVCRCNLTWLSPLSAKGGTWC